MAIGENAIDLTADSVLADRLRFAGRLGRCCNFWRQLPEPRDTIATFAFVAAQRTGHLRVCAQGKGLPFLRGLVSRMAGL